MPPPLLRSSEEPRALAALMFTGRQAMRTNPEKRRPPVLWPHSEADYLVAEV